MSPKRHVAVTKETVMNMTREGIVSAINKKLIVLHRQKSAVLATESELAMFREALEKHDEDQLKLSLSPAKAGK